MSHAALRVSAKSAIRQAPERRDRSRDVRPFRPAGSRPAPIHDRPVFGTLLFAQCWEDPALDAAALRVRPGEVVLSVTSGGCNTLSLALEGARRVYAVDLNPAQSALLELKIAGVKMLRHGEYLELLGARPSRRRAALYGRTRPALPPNARAYWDGRRDWLRSGVLGVGRYERYLALFRLFLRTVQGRDRIRRLFEPRSFEERNRFYAREWNTAAWRLFFRLFFSRKVLGSRGLDRAFFTYVEEVPDFGAHFLERARHALVELPPAENYFLAQICLGRYRDERSMPPYLLAEHYPALREGVERIVVVTQELGAFLSCLPDDAVDAFNYSNVFEWVPAGVFETMLRETHRVARPGARLCYRNLLVRRTTPPALRDRFLRDEDLGGRLLWKDRSFVYSHFEAVRVRKPAPAEDRS
jgi:S-adenosylmethionine-diacylglycerol 3-amino-3-carboxypropyl transferase